MLERFTSAVMSAHAVRHGDHYDIYPEIGSIHIEPEVLSEVTDHISEMGLDRIDMLVAVESMAIPLATSLTLKTGIPFTIVRKRGYGFADEVSVEARTGFTREPYYINGLKRGDRIVLLDDIAATGETIRAIIKALQSMGVVIDMVLFLVEKRGNLSTLERELGVRMRALASVRIEEGNIILQGEESAP